MYVEGITAWNFMGYLMIVVGWPALTGLVGPNGWRHWSVVLGVMAAGASAFYLLDVSDGGWR